MVPPCTHLLHSEKRKINKSFLIILFILRFWKHHQVLFSVSTMHLKYVYCSPSLLLPPQTKPPQALTWDTQCPSSHIRSIPHRTAKELSMLLLHLNWIASHSLWNKTQNHFQNVWGCLPPQLSLPSPHESLGSSLSLELTETTPTLGLCTFVLLTVTLFLCSSHYLSLRSCLVGHPSWPFWIGLPWSTDLRCPPGLPHQEVASFMTANTVCGL